MYRRRRFTKRQRTIAKIASCPPPELKAVDICWDGTNAPPIYPINTTGSLTLINAIQQGTAFYNRVGNKVAMKSVMISGAIVPLGTQATPDYCRIIILYDRQPNGSTPNVSDIINEYDQVGTGAGHIQSNCYSGLNLNNRDRFKVHADWRIILPSITDTSGVITNIGFIDPVSTTFNVKKYIKLKNAPVVYNTGNPNPATIAQIQTGALWMLIVGRIPSGSSPGFQAQLDIRLRFYD